MSQIARKGIIVLLPVLILMIAGCSSQNSKSSFDPDTGKHSITGWSNPDAHGTRAMLSSSEGGLASCQECHGDDFSGGISNIACSTCHGVSAPHPQTWTSGARKHSDTDQSNAAVCAVCHTDGANSPIQPAAQPLAGAAPGCFNNTLCHDQNIGHAPGWASPDAHGASVKSQANGFSGCKTCHGSDFSGGSANTACSLCHGASAPHPPLPWIYTSPTSTRTHTTTNTGNASVCADCHAGGANLTSLPTPTPAPPAGTPAGCFNNTLCHAQLGHAAGWAGPDAHGAAAKSAPSGTDLKGFSTCQPCHGNDFSGNTALSCLNAAGCHGAGVNSPHAKQPWVTSPTSTMNHKTTDPANASVCGLCHWNNVQPPAYSTPIPGTPNCFDNTLCHGPTVGCVDCHNTAVNAPTASSLSGGTVTQRRAIVPEFQQTWSHKRSAGNTVTNQDCAVCHMEGNVSDGTSNPAFHRNGTIELRDPDTGTTIEGVTFGGAGAGSYASTGSSLGFDRFSRDLSSSTLEPAVQAIQINHCLKCHDADGATSTSAQVPTGSALQPFGVAITGHVAPYNSNGNGNVVNVDSSFNTTNSAYHPVKGRQNNSYVQGTKAIAPWNMTKTNGQTNQWGYLMSCWDCHAPDGASGVQTGTVTAHGGATTVRAPYRDNNGGQTAAANLCLNCHDTTYATSGSNHGTGSAFGTGGGSMTSRLPQCDYCHGYQGPDNTTLPSALQTARPLRAEDAHGFNDRDPQTAGDQTWPSGSRPYAFLRQTLNNWHPNSVTTETLTKITANAGCQATSGTCNNNMSNRNYTPGGAY